MSKNNKKKKYRPGMVDKKAGALKILRLAKEGQILALADAVNPASSEKCDLVIASVHSAMESMTSGKAPGYEDWSILADSVQAVVCLIERGNISQEEGNDLAVNAMKALVLASERKESGKQLRFDGEGIKAIKEIIDVFDQAIRGLPEREVLQVMMQTKRAQEMALYQISASRAS